jgi:hypothetical protein
LRDAVVDESLIAIANAVYRERYSDAQALFLAGSLIRGEGTSTSDLDLVVVFKQLQAAYRESFLFGQRRVEAFVHDPETLRYFFANVDGVSGVPSLQAMVSEGIEIPRPTQLSQSLKELAKQIIAGGPPPWEKSEIDASRYMITNLIDDLREPRSRAEQTACASTLYSAIANHYLRTRGQWSAKDKTIPRQLRRHAASFSENFDAAFEALFRDGDSHKVNALAEEMLAFDGGWLFDGYAVRAPADWRVR